MDLLFYRGETLLIFQQYAAHVQRQTATRVADFRPRRLYTIVCAWCSTVLAVGESNWVSHGICGECEKKF